MSVTQAASQTRVFEGTGIKSLAFEPAPTLPTTTSGLRSTSADDILSRVGASGNHGAVQTLIALLPVSFFEGVSSHAHPSTPLRTAGRLDHRLANGQGMPIHDAVRGMSS